MGVMGVTWLARGFGEEALGADEGLWELMGSLGD